MAGARPPVPRDPKLHPEVRYTKRSIGRIEQEVPHRRWHPTELRRRGGTVTAEIQVPTNDFPTDSDDSTRIDATGASNASWRTPGYILPCPNSNEHRNQWRRRFLPRRRPRIGVFFMRRRRSAWRVISCCSDHPQSPRTPTEPRLTTRTRIGRGGSSSLRQVSRAAATDTPLLLHWRRSAMRFLGKS
jgi:hypothetical protein